MSERGKLAEVLDAMFFESRALKNDARTQREALVQHYVERVAAALREGDGWQPIETAPKDGTPVRIYSPLWVDPDFNPSGSHEAHWNDDAGWQGAYWCDRHDAWETRDGMNPTHWQPLPPPPEKSNA